MCVRKYFRGLLTVSRPAPPNSSVETREVENKGDTDSIFPADAGFVGEKALAAAAVLSENI